MGHKLHFDFDKLPPTFNRLLANRWVGHNAKKRWVGLLREQIQLDQFPDPCHIKIVWRVMHEQDDDNLVARFKVIGDALKRAGYIIDDKPKHLTLTVSQIVVHHLSDQGFSMDVDEMNPRHARANA